jgi:hypothetical protein
MVASGSTNVSPDRRGAFAAGLLYLAAMLAGLLSVVPVLEEPDYLARIAASGDQLLRGAFFQLLMAPAYVGIALALYPILRRHDEGLALGFVGSRFVAGAFQLLGAVSLPLFLMLGRAYLGAGAPASSYFQTLGGLLREGRDLLNHAGMILALCAGSLMLYRVLYRSRLVPRWLSVWGLVGASLAMSASLLVMFRLVGVTSPTYLGLTGPMALQELVLAVWLMARGFDASEASTSTSR